MQIFLIAVIIALAAGLVWAYRQGLKDGLKIGVIKDKSELQAVDRVFKPPAKPAPIDPRIKAEQERLQKIMANISVYDGTDRGQKDVK